MAATGPVIPLRALQGFFLTMLCAGPLILVVLMAIMPFGEPTIGAGALAAALSVESIVSSRWAARKPLDTTSPQALRESHKRAFFLAFALGEFGMLMSFVISFVVDGYWPFLIGLAGFLLAMAHIAPSRGNLEKKDQELIGRGSRYLLTEVLTRPAEEDESA